MCNILVNYSDEGIQTRKSAAIHVPLSFFYFLIERSNHNPLAHVFVVQVPENGVDAGEACASPSTLIFTFVSRTSRLLPIPPFHFSHYGAR